MNKIQLTLTDLSHAGAKRYSGRLNIPMDTPRQLTKDIIKKATKEAGKANVYKNKQSERKWKGKEASVVWLSLYDSETAGISYCETFWIDKKLPADQRPLALIGNDSVGDIVVKWKGDK